MTGDAPPDREDRKPPVPTNGKGIHLEISHSPHRHRHSHDWIRHMADITLSLSDAEQNWLEHLTSASSDGPGRDIHQKLIIARGAGSRKVDACSCGAVDLDGYLILYTDDGRRFHSTDNCGRAVRSSLHRAIGPATVNGRPIY